MNNIKYFL